MVVEDVVEEDFVVVDEVGVEVVLPPPPPPKYNGEIIVGMPSKHSPVPTLVVMGPFST